MAVGTELESAGVAIARPAGPRGPEGALEAMGKAVDAGGRSMWFVENPGIQLQGHCAPRARACWAGDRQEKGWSLHRSAGGPEARFGIQSVAGKQTECLKKGTEW